jgi:hypothetical protein
MNPAAVQRVVIGMPIVRLLRAAGDKLLNARSAARAVTAKQAAARDVAQKQMLMQQLAETLHAGRGKARK